jgi:transposase-like protein
MGTLLKCPNLSCGSNRQGAAPRFIRWGHYGKLGKQRFRCLYCGVTFSETVGVRGFRSRLSEEKLARIATLLSQGVSYRTIARLEGVDKNTVMNVRRSTLPGPRR